jgi:hypothetical protein
VVQPVLKQFGELASSDFADHPVWIGCHGVDGDEPWYEDTDEETFRPRTGPLPADPTEGMLLVRAIATLRDGTELPGFLTPCTEADVGILQPHVFVGDELFGFWGGIVGIPDDTRSRFYAAVGKAAFDVFPIRVRVDPALSRGTVEALLDGWQGAGDQGSKRRGLRGLFRR